MTDSSYQSLSGFRAEKYAGSLGMEPVLVRNYPSGVKPRETGNCENRYYTVADICAMLGITRKTLFFYDREDLLKPHRRQGPQRAKLYLFEDVERLRTILEYKKAGLLLKEIRCLLEEDNTGSTGSHRLNREFSFPNTVPSGNGSRNSNCE